MNHKKQTVNKEKGKIFNEGILTSHDFICLIEKLAETCEIIGPAAGSKELEVLQHETIKMLEPKKSVKAIFFPQNEPLLYFRNGKCGDPVQVKDVIHTDRPKVLIGFHPCSVRGLSMLDKIFLEGGIRDSCYESRRKDTMIISFACTNPEKYCFCTATGGDPFYEHGQDILAIEMEDKTFYIKIYSEYLNRLFEETVTLAEPTLEKQHQVQKLYKHSLNKLPEKGTGQTLNPAHEDILWDTIHEACISCGICTYMCPTCHCFDIVDEVFGESGMRIRIWDTCQFPYYTQEASGHNPRSEISNRVRNRILHKFSYFVEKYGVYSCVGCGQCTINCPTMMDMKKILEILKNKKVNIKT